MKNKRALKKSSKFRFDEEIKEIQSKYTSISTVTIRNFVDFPLSQKTLKGLADAKFNQPTDIQLDSIGPALQGKDVLGAAVTGSGKTLAFLIPVLEHLFMNKWTRTDGIGAIIISPTRELAFQIFETLKKVGKHHDFSAGLIIGGKNLKFERSRMDQCNILICTPGRLLQHMDENPLFNASTVEMLVLDEADRCLDMGFEQTLNAIVENFPPERQTLLFSATQTNSVRDLARLNLRNAVYIGHAKEQTSVAVPDLLQQNYTVVALEDKITVLWSFIKNHLKQKIIIFFSSCKQVKYIYEIFCKLRPGTSLLALYGTLHQDRRIGIYNDFVKKNNVVLFATDIASRGLDFPLVNWAVQLDCPEDVTQYIHRAGRSARNKARGESLLVLTPSEEVPMLEELKKQNINIMKIQIDSKKLFSPRLKIEAFLAQNSELKATAQRAFLSYIKSVFLMKNKHIFNVHKINMDAYARSLGLVVTPRVRFLERILKPHILHNGPNKIDKQNQLLGTNNFKANDSDSESDKDFITLKRKDHEIEDDASDDELPLPVPRKEKKLLTKVAFAKKALKKKLQINEKRVFNEDGEEITEDRKQMKSTLAKEYENNNKTAGGGIDIEMAKQLLNAEDEYDKQRFRELVKQRHKLLKEKQKHDEVLTEEDAEDLADSENDDNSIDLSWLPDPEEVYNSGKNIANSSSNYPSSEPDGMSESEEPSTKKVKMAKALSLNDAEIIAAQLLAKSV